MRTIFIGDVHGCIEEAYALVDLVQYEPGKDRLIFLGDLIDRGPDPLGVVQWVRNLPGAQCTLGNHEEKMLSFLMKEERERSGGAPNKMRRPHPKRLEEWRSFSEKDLAWLRSLPYTIRVDSCDDLRSPDAWMAVHAGFEPKVKLEDQKNDRIIRIRHVDAKTGEYKGLKGEEHPYNPDGSVRIPEGASDWQSMFELPYNVVYGHAVHSYTKPRHDLAGKHHLMGIDTGCVFGGSLTALILEPEFMRCVSVPAKRRYAEPPAHPLE